MTNINSAACVAPMNLIALVLLSTPKQSMLETDLVRQLELYASLLRQAPYSPLVWITDADGASIVRHGERMGVLQRHKHPLGDVLQMTEENSVLMTYFRNNVLHLMALPSLVACCFLNNRTMRTEDIQRLMWRIYPYMSDELFLRWREDEVAAAVLETLDDMANHGLLESVDGGTQWRRPPTGSTEAVQLSVLAHVTVPIIERYYLVIAVLLKSGSGRISQDVLESQCQLMAQRMSLLYELNSPEFFDKALFKNFIDLLRARNVLGVSAEGRLTYTDMLPAVADDAQLVLHEQIRNSVLQVTHQAFLVSGLIPNWVLIRTAIALATFVRRFAGFVLLRIARADFILSIPDGTARAGAPLRVDLTILNDSDSPLRLELPAPLHARLETRASVATLDLAPERSGALEVAPRQFLRVALQGDVPGQAAADRDADADG